jgi:TRAP transporter T-component
VRVAGEALAGSSPRYAAALAKGQTLLEVLPGIEAAGAEALYWIADDQHRLAASRGLARLLLEEPELRRLFKRVVELASGTFYGGAYLHLAELDLALPTGFGAGLVPVTSELLAAQRLGPTQLETHLVWAERWAVKAQDYRVFQREIAAVQKASLDAAPAIRPENELVKRKAQKLLQAVPELFTRAAIGQK